MKTSLVALSSPGPSPDTVMGELSDENSFQFSTKGQENSEKFNSVHNCRDESTNIANIGVEGAQMQ